MKSVTIEHLAPYLPYGVYLKADMWVEKLVGFEYQANGDHRVQMLIKKDDGRVTYWTPSIKHVYPVLHPLSDVIEKIKVDGEIFIPEEQLSHIYSDEVDYDEEPNHLDIVSNDYFGGEIIPFTGSFFKLIEWHFDVFGLIDKGLAIDVNDLEKNPYQ